MAREKRSSTVRQPAHDPTGHCILLPADVMNQTTRSGTPKRPAQTGFQTGSRCSAASQQEPIWTMARWLGASPQFAGGLWGWESWDPHLPAFASRNRVANGRRPRSHDFGCGRSDGRLATVMRPERQVRATVRWRARGGFRQDQPALPEHTTQLAVPVGSVSLWRAALDLDDWMGGDHQGKASNPAACSEAIHPAVSHPAVATRHLGYPPPWDCRAFPRSLNSTNWELGAGFSWTPFEGYCVLISLANQTKLPALHARNARGLCTQASSAALAGARSSGRDPLPSPAPLAHYAANPGPCLGGPDWRDAGPVAPPDLACSCERTRRSFPFSAGRGQADWG